MNFVVLIGLTLGTTQMRSGHQPHLLLIISGTHGVEGLCGSGCQVGFLRDRVYEGLPNTVGVVLPLGPLYLIHPTLLECVGVSHFCQGPTSAESSDKILLILIDDAASEPHEAAKRNQLFAVAAPTSTGFCR